MVIKHQLFLNILEKLYLHKTNIILKIKKILQSTMFIIMDKYQLIMVYMLLMLVIFLIFYNINNKNTFVYFNDNFFII